MQGPKQQPGPKEKRGCPCALLTPGLQRPTAPGPMSCGGWGCAPHSYPQEAVPGLLPLLSAGPASPRRPAISSLTSPTPSHVPPWSERLVSPLCIPLRGSEPRKAEVGLLHGWGSRPRVVPSKGP